jgi:lactate dehydrogenase-like 2-hydroxyacid dehydrogenase
VRYVSLQSLFTASDIVTLHCPLTPETHHLIGDQALSQMKSGAMLINTGRGALIDTQAVIEALKSGQLGYLGLDVYEEEADLFFEDLSDKVIRRAPAHLSQCRHHRPSGLLHRRGIKEHRGDDARQHHRFRAGAGLDA